MSSFPSLAPRAEAPAAESAGQITVIVADDRERLRRSLCELIEVDATLDLVGEAGDAGGADGEVEAGSADVVVLDLLIPGGASIASIAALRERAPDTPIVVITTSDSLVFAQRALAAGATGYVARERAEHELPQAIRAAARSEQYISPQIAVRLEWLDGALAANGLSPRELEVLRLISLGYTSVEIARKLQLSPRTIETHRAHIHRKLAVATRAELVSYALRRGLLAD